MLGPWMAFGVVVIVFLTVAYMTWLGHPREAAAVAAIQLIGLVTAFLKTGQADKIAPKYPQRKKLTPTREENTSIGAGPDSRTND